jgi:hypothetical protein
MFAQVPLLRGFTWSVHRELQLKRGSPTLTTKLKHNNSTVSVRSLLSAGHLHRLHTQAALPRHASLKLARFQYENRCLLRDGACLCIVRHMSLVHRVFRALFPLFLEQVLELGQPQSWILVF